MYIQLVWTMCSICVSTMSSRCLLYRAPNPNSQSIFSCGSYLMLFVCCYTFIICQSILFVNTFFKFFLFFFTLSHQWDFLLVLNLYTFIICQSILFVNTFLKFFFIFFLPLATNGIFYWYLTSILLLYSAFTFLSILF